MSVERIKHDPKQYGGEQDHVLTFDELAQRLCVAKGCGGQGYCQTAIGLPGSAKTFRIVCRQHHLMIARAIGTVLGDPSEADEARDLASMLAITWDEARKFSAGQATPISPEDWRCGECGGRLAPETVGMFAGTRWVHTCGVTARQARGPRLRIMSGEAEPIRTAYGIDIIIDGLKSTVPPLPIPTSGAGIPIQRDGEECSGG